MRRALRGFEEFLGVRGKSAGRVLIESTGGRGKSALLRRVVRRRCEGSTRARADVPCR